MEILAATQNKHKLEELQQILPEHRILSPADLNIDFDFEETGSTFLENSMGKAFALYKLTGQPVLADDSGLSIPALHGEPGIYSARYGSAPGDKILEAEDRNAYLLKKMEGISDRQAFFTCCMTLVLHTNRFFTVQEIMEGSITYKPVGEHGFGYDPLFYLGKYGKTASELSESEKNKISHRGMAGKRMAALIKSLEEK